MKALMKCASVDCSLYRTVSKNTVLKKGIPLLKSLSSVPEEAKRAIVSGIEKSKDSWSHPQVAIKKLDLKRLGFKPTKLAIPLPGESLGATSWRSGRLHAHKMGDVFLVHRDASSPTSIKGFLEHTIKDTTKALGSMKSAIPPALKKKLCE